MRRRDVAVGAALGGLLTLSVAVDSRLRRAEQPLTDRWRTWPVEARGSMPLGISFRLPQLATLGLDLESSFTRLMEYPFQVVRLGAYWSRIESAPGVFDTRELDWQVEVAARAGKQIVLCVGPLKCFGYPEFFVPPHRLPHALPERTLIRPEQFSSLLAAGTDFAMRIVERYAGDPSVIVWQVEHEAVDPLGMEHSWRLSESFVTRELAAIRSVDPTRPILLNGFLPLTLPVRLTQWSATRDQGDSLDVAQRHADIIGLDYYPRHALARWGGTTLYLDAGQSPWQHARRTAVLTWARANRRRIMVSEGQAEPWEAVTVPPSPRSSVMYSCPPEMVLENYNRWLRWTRAHDVTLEAYLFWGAEYWVQRERSGDSSYLAAFARILEVS